MYTVRICNNRTESGSYFILSEKDKEILEDSHISWGAKGLWLYLINQPNNWSASLKELSVSYENEEIVLSFLNELTKKRYVALEPSNSYFITDSFLPDINLANLLMEGE